MWILSGPHPCSDVVDARRNGKRRSDLGIKWNASRIRAIKRGVPLMCQLSKLDFQWRPSTGLQNMGTPNPSTPTWWVVIWFAHRLPWNMRKVERFLKSGSNISSLLLFLVFVLTFHMLANRHSNSCIRNCLWNRFIPIAHHFLINLKCRVSLSD